MENKYYAYIDTQEDKSKKFIMPRGQVVAGYTIGILVLDVWYPLMPGNVANASSYDYPVRLKRVKGATIPRLLSNDRTLHDDFLSAAKELQEDGVRAIIGACGYFANFQKDLAEELDIPVYLSSLLQFPIIKNGLKKDEEVGIICADENSLTSETMEKVGINEKDLKRCRIIGLQDEPEFSAILEGRGSFDNGQVCNEVVGAAKKVVDNYNIGAILLECSDMPPYAAAVQEAVNLPVFDFITLINWVHNAVARKPFKGFI